MPENLACKPGRSSALRVGLLAYALSTGVALAAETPGIVGKNEWLFYRNELSTSADTPATNTSLDLIRRFNKALSANGIQLAVAMVPLKMRVYPEHLPDNIKVNDYMAGNPQRMRQSLQAAGVPMADLNTSFLSSPKRTGDTALFFRLDSHWSPTGALVASEAIKAEILANPALKQAFDGTPVAAYTMAISKRKRPSNGRDLVDQIGTTTQTFAHEAVAPVLVSRTVPIKDNLLGQRDYQAITLMGSSYSHEWTGFPDALRFALQRDLLSISVGADQGSWVGMESYLRDDAFQTAAPKMLIWEMPERDMRAPPDYKFRDARYVSDNTEWLLRASSWVQATCKPASATAKVMPVGLTGKSGPTGDNDFVEISFDRPLDKLDYLWARATSDGSKTLRLETSALDGATRKINLSVAGDEAAHALKTPLPTAKDGATKVRLYPGKTKQFALQDLRVCRLPDDLLQ